MNLCDVIFKKDLAGRTAILYEQRQISYAELHDQTFAVARGLRALGVELGDRVALLLNDSPEFIAAFVGSTKGPAPSSKANERTNRVTDLTFKRKLSGIFITV